MKEKYLRKKHCSTVTESGRDFTEISLYRPRTPPFEPDFGIGSPKSRGGSRSQKIDQGFLTKFDLKIWAGPQIKGGVLGLGLEGGVLGLYELMLVYRQFRTVSSRSIV